MNNKIDLIIENYSFQYNLREIETLEINREFCKHDMQHFLDVARIMYIMNLENNLGLPKHLIYTTALLHDIGRGEEYENGIDHNIASVHIAKKILLECEYDVSEIDEILKAIGDHRNDNGELNTLSDVLYKCDKLSRNCIHCGATDKCKWSMEKRNSKITY